MSNCAQGHYLQEQLDKATKEIKRLKTAFTKLDNYCEAVRINQHYNAEVMKVPKKPEKWW